jgi:benzoyl-CoA reductase/2-hydroxyglutaryl-CoA dehydratase subunit BcrC/BadD/HgdB
MNKTTERFGRAVGAAMLTSPRRAFTLLKTGFAVGGIQQEVLPEKRLLPHQKHVAAMSTRAILRPLNQPDRSAMVNVFFPCELLHAMDVAPQFTEGLAGYLNGAASEQAFIGFAENAGVPQTLCSYHKTLLGSVLSDVIPPPRFVASTSFACDANMSTFRTIAAHYGVPHFVVDVPPVCTAETIDYVAGQLRAVATGLEETMGARLEEDRLREVVRTANRSLSLYREHYRLLAGKYLPGDVTSEMHKLFPTRILLGTAEAEEYFRLLLEDTRAAASSSGEKRILWAHTIPYWQDSIRDFFNSNSRRQLLGADLNYDALEELDESHPYESMARRLLTNMLNGPAQRRASRLIQEVKTLRADGVVYFCHWGCKLTLGGARLIQEHLERDGIPVLVLDGDGCDRKNINEGQMSTRLQAFSEMLEAGT